jgi:type IV secretory pathway VirB10-like protein
MSAPSRSFDFQAMRQELRANPRTQIALAAFALVLIYALYTFLAPDTPKGRRATTARTGSNLDPRQLLGLRRLPDLAALGKAGELPPPSKVLRDLFMFEAPPPPPAKVKPPPPPPPPTLEELEHQRLAQDKAAEYAARPQDLRYLGFFKGSPSGTVGAFMKGEEPVTLTTGTLLKERWKLISILDTRAEFQNLKYPDLRLVLEVREASGAPTVNQF